MAEHGQLVRQLEDGDGDERGDDGVRAPSRDRGQRPVGGQLGDAVVGYVANGLDDFVGRKNALAIQDMIQHARTPSSSGA